MLLVIVVLLSQLVANMDDGRAAKLRRLDSSRRRLPYISAQALAAVYKDVLEHAIWQTAPAASSSKAEWASLWA